MAVGYKFNRNAVLKSANRRSRKALEFIARDLQHDMKRKLKRQTKAHLHSRPGEPPRICDPYSPLKKLINYAITDKKIYVGPMVFRAAKGKQSRPVPSILEEGGRSISHITVFAHYAPPSFHYGLGWFNSEASRRRALQSERFKMWKRNNSYTINKPVDVKARPFVRVTLDEYLRANCVNKAIQRAKEWCDKRKI